MRFFLILFALVLPGLASAQTTASDGWKGLYQSSVGTMLLRGDGSARIPSELADPSADGFQWEWLEEMERIRVTPYVFQGPHELNQRLDLWPFYFEATERNGKRVLTHTSVFGEYVFVK
jgi:hypothetical protein